MGEAGRRFRDRGEIVTSCDATTPPRSVTAFRQHLLCRHPPRGKSWRHETPRRHHGRPAPAPEEKDSLWPLGHRKKQTGCGGWVFVFGDRPGRAFAPLATSVTLSE